MRWPWKRKPKTGQASSESGLKHRQSPRKEKFGGKNEAAPGWQAITAAFERLYPGQTDPKHYGTIVSWGLGGNNPLDGISVYDGGEYYHFVTYGFSELYEKELEDQNRSGYGFELTLKLKKYCLADAESEILCICGILQALARVSFEKGEVFRPQEYIYTGQTTGMDANSASKITGFITKLDDAGRINTPNGQVEFVQLVGMTDSELRLVLEEKYSVSKLLEKLESDETDYGRAEIANL